MTDKIPMIPKEAIPWYELVPHWLGTHIPTLLIGFILGVTIVILFKHWKWLRELVLPFFDEITKALDYVGIKVENMVEGLKKKRPLKLSLEEAIFLGAALLTAGLTTAATITAVFRFLANLMTPLS